MIQSESWLKEGERNYFNEEAFSIWRATCLLQDLQYHDQRKLVFKKMHFFLKHQ